AERGRCSRSLPIRSVAMNPSVAGDHVPTQLLPGAGRARTGFFSSPFSYTLVACVKSASSTIMTRKSVLLCLASAELTRSPRCLSIMAQRDDKRQQRQLKREIKRAGNKRRRQHLKRDLERNPEEAAY